MFITKCFILCISDFGGKSPDRKGGKLVFV